MSRKTTRKPKPPKAWGPTPRLSAELQAKIGEQLREMHDDIIRQGVPPRFADLLAKLDTSEDEKLK